jgi:hypothetical protein
MHSMTRRALLPGLLLALAAAPPALAQTDEQQIGVQPFGASKVSSYGGVTVWSETEADSAETVDVPRPGFERPLQRQPVYLVAREDGQKRRLPIEPRAVAFDVDVGPDEQGRPVAVYSRCDPPVDFRLNAYGFGSGDFPTYTTGENCDLYRFDFATERESAIEGASTDQASEMLPSIWRDEIAFARVYEQREGNRGRYPYLYVRRLDGEGESRRQPGSSRGSSGLPGPTSLDLYGSRLALSWAYRVDRSEIDTQAEVRLVDVDGDTQVISKYRSDDPIAYLSPQISSGRLFYGYRRLGFGASGPGEPDEVSVSSRLFRYRISTAEKAAAGAPGVLVSTVTDALEDVTYLAVREEGGGPTRILRRDLPDFE